MSYFAILGTFTELCREELLSLQLQNLVITQGVAFFDSYIGDITKLAGVIKYGEVATEETLYKYFTNILLLGSNSDSLAKFIKQSGRVRRRKQLKDIRSSDLELKKAGSLEVLEIDGKYCVVQGYQDIEHFEQIDFQKPARGMEIGMMPSKLTQMLVNIALVIRNKNQVVSNSSVASQLTTDNCQPITVYDPFCGFGTTGFVANYLGHHFIGSDINITPCKENAKRRKNGIGQKFDRFFTVFRQDVTESFLAKKNLDHVDVIVSEGWLGPVIKNFHQRETRKEEVLKKIYSVYAGFLKNYAERFQGKTVPVIITIPVYQIDGSSIQVHLAQWCKELGLSFRVLSQDYVRKGQNVGRRVCIIDFAS